MKNKFFVFLIGLIFILASVFVLAVPSWNGAIGGNYQVSEDTVFTWNFTNNVTNPEYPMTFTITSLGYSSNSSYNYQNFPSWLSLNSSTGVMTINVTTNRDTGFLNISVEVRNSTNLGSTGPFNFNITPVNDAPQFVNLENQSFNITRLFEYIINVSDEENDIPFSFNITFLNCAVASWSNRNCSNSSGRELFTSSQFTTNVTAAWINISFTPNRNDVGNYTINFTVTDLNNTVQPYNATRSKIVTFRVLNENVPPYFNYVCDNERNSGTEDSQFTCRINFTDVDEINNLTINANYSFFKFNSSETNSATISVNASTGFNGSTIVNFTPTDSEVGNWSINISLTDNSDLPIKTNYTIVRFFFSNKNDSVHLNEIANLTAYSTNNYTIYVNASDDDLLVPDKSVYNETLTFSSNNSFVNASSAGNINGTNITQAAIFVDPNILGISGNYSVNISVRDRNNFSISSQVFTIQTIINHAPVWNESLQTTYSINETNAFFLNLSGNVTDADLDAINFSFSNTTAFANFSVNRSTGIINFTSDDAQVGYHDIIINASDGKVSVPKEFNFTVYNINDAPSIESFPAEIVNASNTGTWIHAQEDNATLIAIYVDDNDFIIPANQKSFYAENLTLNVSIQGPNSSLFNFRFVSDWSSPSGPTSSNPERVEYDAVFTPLKADVGNYTVNVNVSDKSNASAFLTFNITVEPVPHNPIMSAIGNQAVAYFETLYIDVNSTDKEDINETNLGSNLTYFIKNLTAGGDFLTINNRTGVINFTYDASLIGVWTYNVSVNDSSGLMDSEVFNVSVYDYPKILSPASNYQFSLKENVSSSLIFSANHSVGDVLNYSILINGVLRNSTRAVGDGTLFSWNFTANFTDETTCSGAVNLTLNISNARLSNSTSWRVNINHTNYPLQFSGTIANMSGGSPRVLNLSGYYYDLDASDFCVNQTIGFKETVVNATNGSISVSVTNKTNYGASPQVSFSATSDASAVYYITAFEYNDTNYGSPILNNISSNNFSVEISVSQVSVPTPTPSSGGGGGSNGEQEKIVSLRIIVPDPVSVKKKDKIIIPIGIVNNGKTDLKGITLSAFVAKNGVVRNDLLASFDKPNIDSLASGRRQNTTMTVDIDTLDSGVFEINMNANVKEPVYSDSTKFYIEVVRDEDVKEKIIFAQELVVNNPACTELKEIVDEARKLLEQGKVDEARSKTEEAIQACQKAISQPVGNRVLKRVSDNIFGIVGAASIIAFALGLAFYYYKRLKLRSELSYYQNRISDATDKTEQGFYRNSYS